MSSKKILFISDFTLEPFVNKKIRKSYSLNKKSYECNFLKITFPYEKSFILKNNYDCIVVWLTLSDLNYMDDNKSMQRSNQIESILLNFYRGILKTYNTNIIWIGFDEYCMKQSFFIGNVFEYDNYMYKLNSFLVKNIINYGVLIDIKKIISNVGIPNAYNFRTYYLWDCIYSQETIDSIIDEIVKQYKIKNHIIPKCIVLDCDNVLWGGIIQEDGINGLKLGSIGIGRLYKDFQKIMVELYNKGLILAVSSKNDLQDVKHIFNNHSEMILKEHHISYFAVNWNDKATNIDIISKSLNILPKDIVFIDDSCYELASVKKQIPSIKTIQFKPFSIFDELKKLDIDYNAEIDVNAKARIETYQTNYLREKNKNLSMNQNDYLSKIDNHICISKATEIDLNRISELTLKTNKANNGTRYTLLKLKEFYNNKDNLLYKVDVSDKYGTLGLVGCFGVTNINFHRSINIFCLSCRAFGRNVENEMMAYMIRNLKVDRMFFEETEYNKEFFLTLLKKIKEEFNLEIKTIKEVE